MSIFGNNDGPTSKVSLRDTFVVVFALASNTTRNFVEVLLALTTHVVHHGGKMRGRFWHWLGMAEVQVLLDYFLKSSPVSLPED